MTHSSHCSSVLPGFFVYVGLNLNDLIYSDDSAERGVFTEALYRLQNSQVVKGYGQRN